MKFFRFITFLVTFSLIVLLTFAPEKVTPAHADVIGPSECFPAVLMLKGSGEGMVDGSPVKPNIYVPTGKIDPYIVTNGHEGKKDKESFRGFC